jgi:hypothetical protein
VGVVHSQYHTRIWREAAERRRLQSVLWQGRSRGEFDEHDTQERPRLLHHFTRHDPPALTPELTLPSPESPRSP